MKKKTRKSRISDESGKKFWYGCKGKRQSKRQRGKRKKRGPWKSGSRSNEYQVMGLRLITPETELKPQTKTKKHKKKKKTKKTKKKKKKKMTKQKKTTKKKKRRRRECGVDVPWSRGSCGEELYQKKT